MTCITPIVLTALIGLVGAPEPKVVYESHSRRDALEDFRFSTLPAPSRTDAANVAKLRVVTGEPEPGVSHVGRLNDGRLPCAEDQPQANFFFAAGSVGGRVLMEFTDSKEIQQINSYSWHSDVRADQVYKVYGDTGDASIAVPSELDVDPVMSGWQLIASVDSRSKSPRGGQRGISIQSQAESAIGAHRRLLFDLQPTETDDRWGLTFFSEIDVVDGREYPPRARENDDLDVVDVQDKYELTFDTSQTPELDSWVNETLKPVCRDWYPKIVELLPSEGFTAPRRLTITFHREMDGVAYTNGKQVHCAWPWFQRNLKGEAAGAVVHELVHVVQQYPRRRGPNANPSWLVEGVADYIRWFLYEPVNLQPRPNPEKSKYTDSYRTTAAFLNYLVRKHDQDVVKKINTAMRDGSYSSEFWNKTLGKSVDDLWDEYVETLKK